MARQAPSGKRTPIVTALPPTPVDGQEVRFLADATNGIVWNLRYRAASASAYKWEVLGGPALDVESWGTLSVASGGSPVNDASNVITVPLAGQYDFSGHAKFVPNAGAACQIQTFVNAAAVALETFFGYLPVSTTLSLVVPSYRKVLAKNDVLSLGYFQNSGSAASVIARILQLVPVRVG